MPKLQIIETIQGIEELKNALMEQDFVAFDIETTGVKKGSEVIGFSICSDEATAFYVCLQYWQIHPNDGGSLVQTELGKHLNDVIRPFLSDLSKYSLITHNGIFDCAMVADYFKVELINSIHTDTMILAHLLDENRRVGLKELGNSIFGEDSSKEAIEVKASVLANGGGITKDNYEMYKADKDILGKYGAKDALLTFRLFLNLVPELYKQGLEKFFYEDESMPLFRGPTYELNTIGLKVDQQALIKLKATLQTECAEAKDYIYKEIKNYIMHKYPGTNKKNTFNIGSNQQLSWLLFGQMKLEFNTLTDAGKEACKDLGLKLPYSFAAKREFISCCLDSTGTIQKPEVKGLLKNTRAKKFKEPWAYIAVDKKTLAKLAPKFKWIEKLLEYNRKMKILNTYVEGIEERLNYGVLYPSFLQHGTTSGRYSSRNPNFQNLPRDDKRVKACIVSRPGKVFVGADYSQLEPRVFAFYSNDERLLQAFKGTTDFYSTIGMEVYGKTDCLPIKEGDPDAFGIKYKKLRDLSKVIALASTYGATAKQLSSTTNKSINETQEDIDSYFEKFPGVAEMMLEAHELAKKHGFVENLFGRKRRMPEAQKINKIYGNIPHAELPYEARNILNLAVNHRIQSTGASICNRAAIKFYEYKNEIKIDCRIVSQVHDSIIVECNEKDAEDVVKLLQHAMEKAVELPTVSLEAIPKIGNNLSEV